jgi:hypothetical protein
MPFRRSPKLSYGPTKQGTQHPVNGEIPAVRRSAAHSTAVRYDGAMKSPKVGKQRSASGAFSLSRALPKLSLPVSAPRHSAARPKPSIGKPNPGGTVKGGRNG